MNLPLKGLLVLEFSQYLAGPSAGLRLADLGARVIKIERPKGGDACRQLAIKNLWADDGSSLLFHTINRNKESVAADLKNPEDLAFIKQLIAKADVITHNFRPGVMDKVGLDYASVKALNPKLIYAEVSGYGKEGAWKNRPGQDLLLQSMTGLVHTTGNQDDNPMPFGIAVADIICGTHLVQGILAALIRRHKRGVGALIEVSLMESVLDFQFELLTTYFADKKNPTRSKISNGHPLLAAPYGIYQTSNSHLAIAMVALDKLAKSLQCEALLAYSQEDAFTKRDEIKAHLADFLQEKTTQEWLEILQKSGIWAIEVMNWQQMKAHPAYQVLEMEQAIVTQNGQEIITTRCPIRINGERLRSSKSAPILGGDTQRIKEEL